MPKSSKSSVTKWSVKLLPEARGDLLEIRKAGLEAVVAEALQLIADLAEDPFPVGAIELIGHPGVWRLKFYRGRYRIVYKLSEKQALVLVARIKERSAGVYSGLERKLPPVIRM